MEEKALTIERPVSQHAFVWDAIFVRTSFPVAMRFYASGSVCDVSTCKSYGLACERKHMKVSNNREVR